MSSPENFPNSSTDLVKLIAKKQAEVKQLNNLITGLKAELDAHLAQGQCTDKLLVDGLIATRVKKEGKWNYSEFTNQLAKKYTEDLQIQMASEREEGTATQNEPTFYWRVAKARE
tara:strand:+ start:478 stop:822 length:345 start_codon:yes stop_codon:yes gene_type:complete